MVASVCTFTPPRVTPTGDRHLVGLHPLHARAITDNINTSSLLINLCHSGKATTRPGDPVTLTDDTVDAVADQIDLLRANPDLVPHYIPNRDRLMRIY